MQLLFYSIGVKVDETSLNFAPGFNLGSNNASW